MDSYLAPAIFNASQHPKKQINVSDSSQELYSSYCIVFSATERRFFAVLEELFRFRAKFSGYEQSFRNWPVLLLIEGSGSIKIKTIARTIVPLFLSVSHRY